jgi:hypothetical protein
MKASGKLNEKLNRIRFQKKYFSCFKSIVFCSNNFKILGKLAFSTSQRRCRLEIIVIEVACPTCDTVYSLKPELAGRVVKCRACAQPFEVPELHELQQDAPEFAPQLSSSTQNPSRSRKRKQDVDEHGFFHDYDDAHHTDQSQTFTDHEDDDHDERLMQEAARRGALYFEEPRPSPSASILPGQRSRKNAAFPKEIVYLLGFGTVACLVVFGLVRFLSSDAYNAMAMGVDSVVASEFSQPGDKPIGSPAPAAAKIDKSLPVRDLSKHRQLMRDLISQFTAMGDALSAIQDQASAEAQGPRIEGISNQLREIQGRSRTEGIFNPNPKENQILAKEFGKSLRAAGERIRDQLRRMQQSSRFPAAMSMSISRVEGGLRQMEQSFISAGELADGESYVEVRVAGLRSNDERGYIGYLLKELISPAASRSSSPTLAAARYSFWPVERPSAVAGKINFGKVIRTKGKEIWVVANPIDPSAIQQWKDTVTEEANRLNGRMANNNPAQNAQAPAPRPEEPKPPDGADEITKALFYLGDGNLLKRNSAMDQLMKANLNGRGNEVLDKIGTLMEGQNLFFVRSLVQLAQRCSPEDQFKFFQSRLSANNSGCQPEVFAAFGALKDPKIIQPMIENYNDSVRNQVKTAIIAIGPKAEGEVIQMLGSGDPGRRQFACEILAEIGGDETLAAMRKLRPDTVPSVRDAARAAFTAINNRKKLKG